MPEKEEITKEDVAQVVEETAGVELPESEVAKIEAAVKQAPRPFKGERQKNERRPSKRPERARQEFDSKIISVRRVTRVVAGGRRFSFSISMVVGDRKGRVGVGIGKATDTPIAVDKAMRDAKKNLITVALNNKNSIAHPVEAKYSSARISLMPAPGKGVIAGSSLRVVLELAGIKEVSSKIFSRSKNKLNIARAALKALSKVKKPKAKAVEAVQNPQKDS